MLNLCGSCTVTVDQNGTNQYSYIASINNGISDKICLNQGFSAFMGSLTQQLDAYQMGVTELINADIRWQVFLMSGCKFITQTGTSAANMLTGGEYQYNTPVPTTVSNCTLPFALLQSINRLMRTNLRAKTFGSGAEAHARYIGSADLLDSLRNDLGGAAGPGGYNTVPLGSLSQGNNAMAQKALMSFMFEPLYRGMQFGEDPLPLRLDYNGSAYFPVDPNQAYNATVGTVSSISQAWVNAGYEVSFLFYEQSFERQVPAPWTGEGKTRFMRQMFGGEIQFMNHPDMTSNLWGDYGVMAYRIGRAYRPLYPWMVASIISKRCQEVDNTVTCTGVSGL